MSPGLDALSPQERGLEFYDKNCGTEFEWSESTASKLEQLGLLKLGHMANG